MAGWDVLVLVDQHFVGVTTILEENYENIIKILANKFIKRLHCSQFANSSSRSKRNRIYEFNMRRASDNTLLMVVRI